SRSRRSFHDAEPRVLSNGSLVCKRRNTMENPRRSPSAARGGSAVHSTLRFGLAKGQQFPSAGEVCHRRSAYDHLYMYYELVGLMTARAELHDSTLIDPTFPGHASPRPASRDSPRRSAQTPEPADFFGDLAIPACSEGSSRRLGRSISFERYKRSTAA